MARPIVSWASSGTPKGRRSWARAHRHELGQELFREGSTERILDTCTQPIDRLAKKNTCVKKRTIASRRPQPIPAIWRNLYSMTPTHPHAQHGSLGPPPSSSLWTLPAKRPCTIAIVAMDLGHAPERRGVKSGIRGKQACLTYFLINIIRSLFYDSPALLPTHFSYHVSPSISLTHFSCPICALISLTIFSTSIPLRPTPSDSPHCTPMTFQRN